MAIGEKLAGAAKPYDVIIMSGDLGAGKTQFSKGFAQGLGVDDDVTSPTFNILVEYVGDEWPMLHFDLYRLDDEEDLADIDFYGMLESGGICLVEWGNKFPAALPDEYLDVQILVNDDGARTLNIEGVGARGKELEAVLAA